MVALVQLCVKILGVLSYIAKLSCGVYGRHIIIAFLLNKYVLVGVVIHIDEVELGTGGGVSSSIGY